MSLHLLGHFSPRQVEQGRRKVGVVDQPAVLAAGLDQLWVAHDERHAHRFFVHPALVAEVVFAQEKALIGGIDDDGVVQFAGLFEIVEQALDVVVHTLYTTQVPLHVALVGFFDIRIALKIGQFPIDTELSAKAPGRIFLQPVAVLTRGFGAEVLAGLVVQIRRLGDLDIIQVAVVPRRVLIHVVRRLEVVHQKEGLVTFPTVGKPVEADVRDRIARVLAIELDRVLWPGLITLHSKRRAHVVALAGQDAVVVERAGLLLEVPLADHRGVIARALHLLGQVLSL